MKRLAFLFGVMLAAVMAQAAPGPATATTPSVATNAPAGKTNAVSFFIELRDIEAKLYPIEQALAKTEPDLKALVQQRKDMQQALMQLDKKRMDLITAKLLANPATAPLVKRRAELQAKRTAAQSGAPTGDVAAKPRPPGFGSPQPLPSPQ